MSVGIASSAKPSLLLLARYHWWANRQICDAVRRAAHESGEDIAAAHDGTFFGSIHATVSHLAGVDDLWFRRLTAKKEDSYAMYNYYYAADTPPSAWKYLYSDFEAATSALNAGSQRWLEYVATLPEAALDDRVTFLDTANVPTQRQRAASLFHVFNHGTHHRGQIHAALTSIQNGTLRHHAPALDMPLMGAELFVVK